MYLTTLLSKVFSFNDFFWEREQRQGRGRECDVQTDIRTDRQTFLRKYSFRHHNQSICQIIFCGMFVPRLTFKVEESNTQALMMPNSLCKGPLISEVTLVENRSKK